MVWKIRKSEIHGDGILEEGNYYTANLIEFFLEYKLCFYPNWLDTSNAIKI